MRQMAQPLPRRLLGPMRVTMMWRLRLLLGRQAFVLLHVVSCESCYFILLLVLKLTAKLFIGAGSDASLYQAQPVPLVLQLVLLVVVHKASVYIWLLHVIVGSRHIFKSTPILASWITWTPRSWKASSWRILCSTSLCVSLALLQIKKYYRFILSVAIS